jgi:hypothetical protein
MAETDCADEADEHAPVWAACAELNGSCSCAVAGDRCCESLRDVFGNEANPVASECERIAAELQCAPE